MGVQAGSCDKPSNSSSYALLHVDLSSGDSDIIFIRVGGDKFCRQAAETWRATDCWNCC